MASDKRKNNTNHRRLTDDEIKKLEKIAFANIDDFARFDPDGGVHIFDYEKARDIGAKVKVETRVSVEGSMPERCG